MPENNRANRELQAAPGLSLIPRNLRWSKPPKECSSNNGDFAKIAHVIVMEIMRVLHLKGAMVKVVGVYAILARVRR